MIHAKWCLLLVGALLLLVPQGMPSAIELNDEFLASLNELPIPIVELPIKLIDNRVQLTLPVENYNLTFVLDTGASRTVIFQSAKYDFNDLPSLKETKVIFPALDEYVTGVTLAPLSIYLGDHIFSPSRPILIKQRPPIGERLSFKFDGILGQDFFGKYVVEIDPKNNTLSLYTPGTNLAAYYGTHVKLFMKGSAPHLRLRTKLPWEEHSSLKELLLDTGYPGAMVIWNRKHFSKAAGSHKVEAFQQENKGVVILSRFRLGSLNFNRVPLFIAPKVPKQASKRDGLIGSNVLVQFKHVIDLGGRQLLLSTGKKRYTLPIDGTVYPPNNEAFVSKTADAFKKHQFMAIRVSVIK